MNKDRLFLLFLGIGTVFLLSILVVQFYQIQIIDGEKWLKEANKQHYFSISEPFTRGTFYSSGSIKKGHPEKAQKLVVDIQKFHLYIDPDSLPESSKKEIVKTLARHLDLSSGEISSFSSHFYKKSRSRKLASWIDGELKDSILEWWAPFAKKRKIPRNALFFVSDYQRSYPFGKLLGQVLHTVRDTKDEKTAQGIPTGGLELYFNRLLKGKGGKRLLMRSPRNAIEIGEVLSPPENGSDIYLTVNHTLQAICEEELEKGVAKCKAKSGWAVMMEPHTGDILAMAQYPFFDPSQYQKYFNDPLLVEHTKVKAVTDANEPGSMMKAVSIATALIANQELKKRGEAPLFDIDEKIPCSNGQFPGRSKPITDTHLHYFLNMDMAIKKSSNIYVARLFERIINRLGAEWLRTTLQDTFGFGIKTGIELPAESPGVLPRFGKRHPNGALEWSTSTPFSMAFGHNFQATSMQQLRALAIIVNGGHVVQPGIVRKIVKKNQDGAEKILYERQPKSKKVLDTQIADRARDAMKYVTKPGGTCRRGDVFGYTEGGKSGTPKKIVNGTYSETLYIPSYIGFTPAKDPAFILVVTMDEPEYGYIPGWGKNHHGGVCGGAVFREIARRSLEYLGIAPDDPYGYPVGDPRRDPKKADWYSENERLDELYNKWNSSSK